MTSSSSIAKTGNMNTVPTTTELYQPKMFFPTPEEAMDRLYCPVNFRDPVYPVQTAFEEGVAYVRKIPEKHTHVPDLTRLRFYSLFKQATEGDIDESTVKQPSMIRDWQGYWKVFGWRKLKGTPRETARDDYVKRLEQQIAKNSTVRWAPPEDPWEAFYEGVNIVRVLPKKPMALPDTLRAAFYALYKQATVGDLRAFQQTDAVRKNKQYKWLRERPSKAGSFDQLRYDAWLALDGVTKREAMCRYCIDLYREGCRYGAVWSPPGTEDHMEVVGDQRTAKSKQRGSASGTDACSTTPSALKETHSDDESDEKFFLGSKKQHGE